ncbi:phosphotransferase [Nocardia sp. 2]|uniref:Phosphotransferase n=1 Tax=Nocardia acididurans TaxID=2802282 RepID=A0ABS1MHD9_9NOCA|nr:phosphotransferase [Nocardia acididurans]
MDLAEGRRWSKALNSGAGLRDSWAEALFRFSFCFGNRARRGLFHGDPHPGNYLLHDDGTVSILDFGYIKRYTTARHRAGGE